MRRISRGLRSTEAYNLTSEGFDDDRHRAPSADLGKVYLRTQMFYRNADKGAEGSSDATIYLLEETYASSAQAEQRAQEIGARMRNSTPPKDYFITFEDAFALENRVYRMVGWTRDRRGGVPELLSVLKDHLRRHCEETTTHEVRFYD